MVELVTLKKNCRKPVWLSWAAALILGVLLVGPAGWCGQIASPAKPAQPEPQTKPAPATPIAEKKVELDGYDPWNPAWDRMIERALPRDLISKRRAAAVEPLCPRFREMSRTDRRAFWAYFFQALAGAEAGLKPTASVRHNDPAVAVMDPVTHRIIRQEGLLQLAYADSRRYGCNFDWQRDKLLPEHDPAKTILNPRNNLLCGIRILKNQLIKQHRPLLSDSSYWVTLRPGHMSFKLFLKQMANEPAVCGSPMRATEALPVSEADSARPSGAGAKPRLSPDAGAADAGAADGAKADAAAADSRARAPAAAEDGSPALPERARPKP
jgi:hypothetical protein